MMEFRSFALRALYLLTIGILLATLWFFRDIWMLVFLAAVVAVGISIPVGYLQRLKVPRALAVAVSALGTVVALLALCFWLFPSVAADLGELFDRLPQFANRITLLYANWRTESEWRSTVLPPLAFQSESGDLTEARFRQLLSETTSVGLPVLVSGGSILASLLANLFLVVMLAIFFLAEPKAYVRASLYLLPPQRHTQFLDLLSVLYHTLRTWISTLAISVSITVALVWLILGSLGMPNVLMVAAFAGISTFVPNIGAFLPLIPITVFTLASDPSRLPLMTVVYLGIQLVESNILTPSIVRRQLSIPPAATLTFQILAGFIFGLPGIFLAVPLLAVTITLVRELYSYGLLGLRGRSVQVALPAPGPHARDTRLPQRASALQKRLRRKRVLVIHDDSDGADKSDVDR